MLAKITKRTVDATKASATDVFVWDSELKGFGLKVTPKGRRIFVVQYWAPALHRVRRRVTLGTYGPLTVEFARDAAQRLMGRVAAGEDPAVEAQEGRRTARDATVALLSTDYLEDVRAKMKAGTAHEYARMFKTYIVPKIGKTPVAHVTLREVASIHLALKKKPYQANRVLQMFKTFFFWVEARGYRARGTNPCRDIAKYPERSHERFLSVAEVGALGSALYVAERTGLAPAPKLRHHPKSAETAKHRPKSADIPKPANPFAVAAIRFLLLTGWREQEALTLLWSAVDLGRGFATLEDTKTGRSHRPLGAPAAQLLAELPRIAGSRYVFPGARAGQPLREIKRTWAAARYAAGLDDVRLHDLRHTVASFAVASGHSLYLTGKLLGHARPETTQRYAHLADDARKATADTVSGAIAAALGASANQTPVLELTA
jgi:integrase